MDNQLEIFDKKPIRSILHEGEMYYSIVDVVGVLTDSPNHQTYWYVLKKRESQLLTLCKKLKFLAPDGKMRPTDCANTEGVLRVIMSVPSPKAEPLKLWLAQTGKQAIDETENPELGIERMKAIYKAKGHTDEWIKNRMQSIETRKLLTDEWQQRGVKEGQEYSIFNGSHCQRYFWFNAE
jgi:DNA-damage-inducible protein D